MERSVSQLLCCNLQCKFTQQAAFHKQKILEWVYSQSQGGSIQTAEKWGHYFLSTSYFFQTKFSKTSWKPFTRTAPEHVTVSGSDWQLTAFAEYHVI